MKRLVFTIALTVLCSCAFAQHKTQEYVSALVTFTTERCPQDSLDKYGVRVTSDNRLTAYVLVPVERYDAFVASDLVSKVIPSNHVFLPVCDQHKDKCKHDGKECKHDGKDCTHDHKDCKHDGKDCKHAGKDCKHQDQIRRDLIPENVILDDEAEGWYIGLLLGGSSNMLRVSKAPLSGNYYSGNGLNLDVRGGYQFTTWFGIRSGLQLVSKNFSSDLLYNNTVYGTYYQNYYLQLPVMADFSVGNNVVRLHGMVGGYCAWWMTQMRNGFVYSPKGTTGTGYKQGFESDMDQRWDAGLAGSLALSFRIAPAWQLYFEGNYYYGLTSFMKADYGKIKNRTATFGMGVTYQF